MSVSLSRSAAGLGMASERTRLRMVARLREQGIRDEVVLTAMAQVPRHVFVEEAFASRAYEDTALPIGFGQTISQPYVVARSCELARAGRALDMVLEIGGGCGYQAAVLGRLAREVYTIERIGALAAKARQTLSAAGVNNVKVRNADGREASSNVIQFDAILVAAGGAAFLVRGMLGGGTPQVEAKPAPVTKANLLTVECAIIHWDPCVLRHIRLLCCSETLLS